MAFERASIVVRSSVGVIAMVSLAAVSHANPTKPLTNAGPVLEEFGKQAQDQSLSEAERIQVISLLGLWATEDVRAPLMALLDDPLPSVRAAAARGLGWKGNQAAAAALKTRLTTPGEPVPVRVAVLESLGKIGDASVRDVVLAATSDPDPAIRGAAFFGVAFENLTNPDDRVPLLRRMAADQAIDRAMRSQSIQALGALRDTGSADLLLRLLESEPSVAMPQPPAVPTERDNMATRYRQARDVRAWVARSLWMIQAKAAVPLLLKTAEDPHDYFLRLVSLEALANWKVEEAVPVLLRRLDDTFDQNRVTALWGLGNIGDRRAVDPVLSRATDKVPEVRAQAVTALGMLGDPRVRPQLEALQQSEPDGRVQEALAQTLARLPR